MKIESAIKQSAPFQSEYQKLIVNLMYTNGWLRERLSNFFSAYDVTVKQYNILRILKGANKPVSTSFIRHRLIDKMSDTSRIIDRMVKKGLVEKNTCKQDKRLIDISLSDQGIKTLENIAVHIHEMDNLFPNIGIEEVKQLNQLLDKSRTI